MSELTEEQRQVIAKRVAEAAVESELATGCPAELSAAQCILESGWLRVCPQNNCFGIKDTNRYPGNRYTETKEYLNGKWVKIVAAFEVYATLADCFTDHARLITGKYQPKGKYALAWRDYVESGDFDKYVSAIATVYATDPAYREQVLQIARGKRVVFAVAAARARRGDREQGVAVG